MFKSIKGTLNNLDRNDTRKHSVGVVSVNWKNPLTRGLKRCVRGLDELVTGHRCVTTGGTLVNTPLGPAWQSGGAGTRYYIPYFAGAATPGAPSTFTCIVFSHLPGATDFIGNAVSCTASVGGNGGWGLAPWSYGYPGQTDLVGFGVSYGQSGLAPSTSPSIWGAGSDAGGITHAVDGLTSVIAPHDTNDFLTYDTITVGESVRESGPFDPMPAGSRVLMVLLWDRRLSVAEMQAVTTDISQVLTLTSPLEFLTLLRAAAGGTNTVVDTAIGFMTSLLPASVRAAQATAPIGLASSIAPTKSKGVFPTSLLDLLLSTGAVSSKNTTPLTASAVSAGVAALSANKAVLVSSGINGVISGQALANAAKVISSNVVTSVLLTGNGVAYYGITSGISINVAASGTTLTPVEVFGNVGVLVDAQGATNIACAVQILAAMVLNADGQALRALQGSIQAALSVASLASYGLIVELTAAIGIGAQASGEGARGVVLNTMTDIRADLSASVLGQFQVIGEASVTALGQALVAAHYAATGEQLLFIEVEAGASSIDLILATPDARIIRITLDNRVLSFSSPDNQVTAR